MDYALVEVKHYIDGRKRAILRLLERDMDGLITLTLEEKAALEAQYKSFITLGLGLIHFGFKLESEDKCCGKCK